MVLANIKMFRAVNIGTGERGQGMPNKNPSSFTSKPMNIRKATLNPTENVRISIFLISSGFSSWMMSKPGAIVKYAKPNICLATETSRNIRAFATSWKAVKVIRVFIFLFCIFSPNKLYRNT